jgi:cytochrome P450
LSTSSLVVNMLSSGTANSSPAAFWAIFEVARDPELLQSVRDEAESCLIGGTEDNPRFEMERLLKKPILQAVIAETLRLRVHGIIPRKSPVQGVSVHGSVIPRHKLFFINSTTEHMDPKVWCTRAARHHPPEEFWHRRFLLAPACEGGEPTYTINGKSGSWLPFGGGAHMCPGRFLAKRIMTSCIAHVVTRYDCEVLSDRVAQRGMKGMSLKTFGLGTLHPSERVPVRLSPRNKA